MQEIQGIPRALRQVLETARSEYAAIVRRTRWGSGPIYVCTCGPSGFLGLAAAYAFEWVLGWPVIARRLAVFQHYSLSLPAPRSVFLILSSAEDVSAAQELAHKVRQRGSTVLVLSADPNDLLAGVADERILVKSGDPAGSVATLVCELFALYYFVILTARILKRPNPLWESIEVEFDQLPSHLEWALVQLSGALRSLSNELKVLQSLWVVGGGFYHAPAVRAAWRLRELSAIQGEGVEASEFRWRPLATLSRNEAVLFVSSSRCGIKQEVHEAAAQARVMGARVLSLTDQGDRELADRSDMALLTPTLSEVMGSTLSLTLLEWLALEVARESRRNRTAPGLKSGS